MSAEKFKQSPRAVASKAEVQQKQLTLKMVSTIKLSNQALVHSPKRKAKRISKVPPPPSFSQTKYLPNKGLSPTPSLEALKPNGIFGAGNVTQTILDFRKRSLKQDERSSSLMNETVETFLKKQQKERKEGQQKAMMASYQQHLKHPQELLVGGAGYHTQYLTLAQGKLAQKLSKKATNTIDSSKLGESKEELPEVKQKTQQQSFLTNFASVSPDPHLPSIKSKPFQSTVYNLRNRNHLGNPFRFQKNASNLDQSAPFNEKLAVAYQYSDFQPVQAPFTTLHSKKTSIHTYRMKELESMEPAQSKLEASSPMDVTLNLMRKHQNLSSQSLKKALEEIQKERQEKLVEGSLERIQNAKILEKNNIKKSTNILSNLYRIDDRAIKFKQARSELVKITNEYLARHFEKFSNSRDLLESIEEAEWYRKNRALKEGIELDSRQSEKKFLF